jgi:hypothetical protein
MLERLVARLRLDLLNASHDEAFSAVVTIASRRQ